MHTYLHNSQLFLFMAFASALVTCVNVQYIWHRAAVKARIF